MLDIKWRFLLLGVLLAYGSYTTYTFGIGTSWYIFLAAFFIILAQILFGTVWAAFGQLQQGNIPKAEALLNQIYQPDWLYKSHRAYYYFTRGMIDLRAKRLDLAKVSLEKSYDLGLRTNNDKALIQLNLAHIAFVQKRFEDARKYLATTKELKSSDLMIQQEVRRLGKVLK